MAVTAVLVLAGSASAALIGVNYVPVDNTAGGVALDGFVTQDVTLDFSGQFNSIQMWLQLDTGSIYQDALGADTPPNPGFFGIVPSLQFDTFAAHGGLDSTTSDAVSFAGYAIDLGAPAVAQFDTAGINQTWFSAGSTPVDLTGFPVARISLSDDASGTLSIRVGTNGTDEDIISNIVISGGQIVPEPASLILLGLGGLTMLVRRR